MSQPELCGKRDSYLMSQEISYNFRLRKYDMLLSAAIILGYIKPSYEPL